MNGIANYVASVFTFRNTGPAEPQTPATPSVEDDNQPQDAPATEESSQPVSPPAEVVPEVPRADDIQRPEKISNAQQPKKLSEVQQPEEVSKPLDRIKVIVSTIAKLGKVNKEQARLKKELTELIQGHLQTLVAEEVKEGIKAARQRAIAERSRSGNQDGSNTTPLDKKATRRVIQDCAKSYHSNNLKILLQGIVEHDALLAAEAARRPVNPPKVTPRHPLLVPKSGKIFGYSTDAGPAAPSPSQPIASSSRLISPLPRQPIASSSKLPIPTMPVTPSPSSSIGSPSINEASNGAADHLERSRKRLRLSMDDHKGKGKGKAIVYRLESPPGGDVLEEEINSTFLEGWEILPGDTIMVSSQASDFEEDEPPSRRNIEGVKKNSHWTKEPTSPDKKPYIRHIPKRMDEVQRLQNISGKELKKSMTRDEALQVKAEGEGVLRGLRSSPRQKRVFKYTR